jgi:hypothetical protein
VQTITHASDTVSRRASGRPRRIALVAGAAGSSLAVLWSLWLVLDGSGRGLDLTDEATYLLATGHREPGAAFNGLFGYYTGLLLDAVGGDLTRFRAAGVLLLALVFAGLGHAVARVLLAGEPSGTWTHRGVTLILVLGSVAGGLMYYSVFLRTPSYNWLALLGAAMVMHGLARAFAGDVSGRAAWATATLLGAGSFLTLWGKSTAGPLVALAAAVAVMTGLPISARARWTLLLRTFAVGAGLLLMHFLVILGPGDTVDAYRRSAHTLAAVDPEYYAVAGAVGHFVDELAAAPRRLLEVTGLGVVLVLAPFLTFVLPRRMRPVAVGRITGTTVVLLGVIMLGLGRWSGGVAGYGAGALTALAIGLVALCGWIVSTLVAREQHATERVGAGRRLYLVVPLLVGAGAYAFGSNNGLLPQLTGSVGLIMVAACVLAAGREGGSAGPGRSGRIAGALGVAVMACIAAPVILSDARSAPYRIAALEENSVVIDIGRYGGEVAVDRATATAFGSVERSADRAGWRSGTPLLDLSFLPGLAMVLDADVPKVILPLVGGFPTGTDSTLTALSYQDDRWISEAWLAIDPQRSSVDVSRVLAAHGRTLEGDYRLVGRTAGPWGSTLWLYRPRSG